MSFFTHLLIKASEIYKYNKISKHNYKLIGSLISPVKELWANTHREIPSNTKNSFSGRNSLVESTHLRTGPQFTANLSHLSIREHCQVVNLLSNHHNGPLYPLFRTNWGFISFPHFRAKPHQKVFTTFPMGRLPQISNSLIRPKDF